MIDLFIDFVSLIWVLIVKSELFSQNVLNTKEILLVGTLYVKVCTKKEYSYK
jgi:hypothetical protein